MNAACRQRKECNQTGKAEMTKLTSNTSGNFRTYGIKTAEAERRYTGLYRVIVILLILLVVAAVVWGVKRHLDNRGTARPEQGREQSDNDVSASTFADVLESPDHDETSAAILEHRARELNPDAVALDIREFEQQRIKQQRKLYDTALQAFNERKFDQSRTILRDMLSAMESSDALYDAAASLLGRASMNIYRSGTDSETNVAYTVKSGDTLSRIAVDYNTTVSAIKKTNNLTSDNLKIGQKLQIPQSVWTIVIRRSDNRLVLYTNNNIFKIYKIYPGSAVGDACLGSFKIFSKQKDPVWSVDGQKFPPGSPGNIIGPRWMSLKGTGANANAAGTAIHGTNRSGEPDSTPGAPGYFRMSNDDAKELYDLVPCETSVEIKR